MSDPSLPLQAAIVAALKGAAGVTGIVEQRIYDDVPSAAKFPYVTIGDGDVLGDDSECGDGSEVTTQIHAWSRSTGYPEVKNLAAAIRAALKTPPTLAGFVVNVVEYVRTLFLRDPDGKTRHAVIEFRYVITHST